MLIFLCDLFIALCKVHTETGSIDTVHHQVLCPSLYSCALFENIAPLVPRSFIFYNVMLSAIGFIRTIWKT